jgi:hypothetical protein
MGRRGYLREQWQGWIAEQVESGLSVAAFCEARELPTHSFYHWRRKFKAETAGIEDSPSFVSVSVTGLADVVIELPCGAVIRVPPDEGATRRVIDALLLRGGGR